jgi:hypothetical protein
VFKLSQSPNYYWPVEVKIATDGGSFQTETFDAHFKRPSQDQIDKIVQQTLAGEITDQDVVREYMVGWRGVTSEGVEVPFSQQALAQMLSITGAAAAIVKAFGDSATGGRKAKN